MFNVWLYKKKNESDLTTARRVLANREWLAKREGMSPNEFGIPEVKEFIQSLGKAF